MTQGNAEDQGMIVTGGKCFIGHPISYSEEVLHAERSAGYEM